MDTSKGGAGACIVAVASQKGGTGKTTSVHALGVALAKAGKRVLLVDLDPQASLTISVGIEPLEISKNITSILSKAGGSTAGECVTSLSEKLHIITSIIDLAQLEVDLISRASRERILERALTPLKSDYDFILIDCPPHLGVLTVNALSCADFALVPVKTDYLAYRGLAQLQAIISEIQEYVNPKLKLLGVIATLFEVNVNDDRSILHMLKKSYPVLGVIKRLAATKRGVIDGRCVVEIAPTSENALAYIKVAEIIQKEREVTL